MKTRLPTPKLSARGATVLVAALLVASGAVSANSHNFLEFAAGLSGDQEVPEVITATTGVMRIQFNRNLSQADFKLRVFDGVEVTQAHLHCALAGQNGAVIAFVAGPFDPEVDSDGPLADGTLSNDDIIPRDCDCGGDPEYEVNNIASLASATLDSCIYVNVHTRVNPSGEVRGQILKAVGRLSGPSNDNDEDLY